MARGRSARPELLFRRAHALHLAADERQLEALEVARDALLEAGDRDRAAEAQALLAHAWWYRGHVGSGAERVRAGARAARRRRPRQARGRASSPPSRTSVRSKGIRRRRSGSDGRHSPPPSSRPGGSPRGPSSPRSEGLAPSSGTTPGSPTSRRAGGSRRPPGPRSRSARACNNLAVVLYGDGQLKRAFALLEEALPLAERAGHVYLTRFARAMMLLPVLDGGDVGRVRSARGRVHRRVRGGRTAHLAGVHALSPREHQAGTRRPGRGGRRRRARTRARARGADARPGVPVAGVRGSRVRGDRRARSRTRARVRVRLPHARRPTPAAGVVVHPLRLGGGGRRVGRTSWIGCSPVSSGRRAGCSPRVPSWPATTRKPSALRADGDAAPRGVRAAARGSAARRSRPGLRGRRAPRRGARVLPVGRRGTLHPRGRGAAHGSVRRAQVGRPVSRHPPAVEDRTPRRGFLGCGPLRCRSRGWTDDDTSAAGQEDAAPVGRRVCRLPRVRPDGARARGSGARRQRPRAAGEPERRQPHRPARGHGPHDRADRRAVEREPPSRSGRQPRVHRRSGGDDAAFRVRRPARDADDPARLGAGKRGLRAIGRLVQRARRRAVPLHGEVAARTPSARPRAPARRASPGDPRS